MNECSVDHFLANIGLVFSKIKDSIFKDFLNGLAQEGSSWEDFKSHFKEDGFNAFEEFINAIIQKVGYDISSASESSEVYNLIKSIITTSEKISSSVQQIVESNDGASIKKLVDSYIGSNTSKESNGASFSDLFQGSSSQNPSDAGKSELKLGGEFERLKALFDTVKELFSLIEKISKIEWDKIVDEHKNFEKFINDTYFTKDFAKRILDYVLILFLKNAREVFSDDIERLLQDASANLEDKFAEICKDAARTNEAKIVYAEICRLKDEIAGIDAKISDFEDKFEEIAENSVIELETRKNIAHEKIKKLLEKLFPEYTTTAKIFNRIYAILSFLGIIGTEKIKGISFLPNYNFDSSLKSKNSKKASIPTEFMPEIAKASLPVFHWELVKTMFTDPLSYLKTAFSLKNAEDIEKLIVKTANLIRAFNADFPKIESIKQLAWDLIFRIEDRIQSDIEPLKDEIVAQFSELRSFLYDVLKICESIAVETRNALEAAFCDFEDEAKNAKSEFAALNKDIQKKVDEVKKTVNAAVKFSDAQIEESFRKIVTDTFTETITETLGGKNEDAKTAETIAAIQKKLSFKSCELFKSTENFVKQLKSNVENYFDADSWEEHFEIFIASVKDTFESQTENVPKNLNELKNFALSSVEDLLKKHTFKNPFSDFEPSAYYQIMMDELTSPLTIDFDLFLDDFVECVQKSIENLNAEISPELAASLAQNWWKKIQDKLIDLVVNPFVAALRNVIREWIAEKSKAILDSVKKAVANASEGSIIDTSKYKKLFEKDSAIDAAMNLVQLKNEASNVDSWQDALKFAVKLYSSIPSSVKQYVAELVDIPKWDFSNLHLPDCSFDATDKLLAINLWNYEIKDAKKGNGKISIQLIIYAGDRKTKSSDNTEVTEKGIYILPMIKGNYGVDFNVGSKHYMTFSAHSELNCKAESHEDSGKDDKIKNALTEGKLGFFIKCSDKLSDTRIIPLADDDCITAYLELLFRRGQVDSNGKVQEAEEIHIFDTSVASLTLKDYPQKLFAGYDKGFDVGYSAALNGLNLALKLKEQNNFFNTILKDDILINLEKLNLQYSLKNGFKIENELHIKIPIKSDIDLHFVKFKNIAIDIGLDDGDLLAKMQTSFAVDLKGVSISFSEMGLGISCNLFTKDGKRGSFNISPEFTYPNGLGIGIDVDTVKGSGLVQWDKEKGRFAGALELYILEKIGASAMMLFTTGKGTDPFSFMGALCVYFNPGIQLGMGFALTGIGGSFGVNRMLNTDGLRDSVYDGSLQSILFFKDLNKNFDKVLANIDKFYPIKQGQMYFGFLGRISWGAILSADFGLFIQAPSPVTIVVAGVVKVSVAESVDKLLVINASFIGGIQFDKGFFFDASLFDSKIVGLELQGDMAVRIYWGGNTKGFILSIGGFHPQYKPEAGFNLPEMKRVGLKLDYSIIKFSLDAYFAITSNTVQFGTKMDLRIGWDKFGLTGYSSFNALFQFNPFKFLVDMAAGLAVKIGSTKICSIDLEFELGGPAPWHAKGAASFTFLFVKIKIHFDKTWGKKQVSSDRNRIDILPLFDKAFAEKNNWKFISSDLTDNMVSLAKFDESSLVLQPSDTISFSQSAVPLNVNIGCYGEDDVNDYVKLEVNSIYIGNEKISQFSAEKSSFAPSLIKRLNEKEKLKSKSYQQMDGGFKISSGLGTETSKTNVEVAPKYNDIKQTLGENEPKENPFNWMDLWKTQAEEAAKTKTAKATKKRTAPKKVGNIDEFVRANARQETNANTQQTRTTRSSHRRNAAGFNRYINQLDNFLSSETENKFSK